MDIKAEESHLYSQGKFVLIDGEAGIGKTRMLEEFMDTAENEEFWYELKRSFSCYDIACFLYLFFFHRIKIIMHKCIG